MSPEPYLTNADRMLVRRLRNGETQTQAAVRLGVTRNQYIDWELRRSSPPSRIVPKINRLKPHERCLLLRRKAGLTQEDVAFAIGCCRYWVNLMEQGKAPVEKLVEYWNS